MTRVLILAAFLLTSGVVWAAEPVFSPGGPEAADYGAAEDYPVGSRVVPVPQSSMVGHYSHFSEKYPHRIAARPARASVLRRAGTELTVSYSFGGVVRDLRAYLSRHPATGLLIARGDEILFEHYQYARTDRDRFLSQSMAKTVVAMLVGLAVQDGAIRSIDDAASVYVPELAGTEYGNTPIRALLHMASGVAFKEVYDARGDNMRLNQMLFSRSNPGPAAAVALFNTREAPPDTRFQYAGSETEILGLVVTAAVKMPLTAYMEARIWRPMGAEADASWTIDTTGQETAFCCINAVLRDWARLGLMLAHDGAWNGRQIVPAAWVREATGVHAPFLRPGIVTRYYGYGYQVWLLPGERRQFALLGIHGQAIFVDPVAKLVLVHTAVRMKASQDPAALELRAVWEALVGKLGGE